MGRFMQADISRRQFFKKGALAAAALAVPNVPQVLASQRETDRQLTTH
jgi:hypothetical protein